MNADEIRAAVLGVLKRDTGWEHEYDEDGFPVKVVTPAYRDHVIDGIAQELGIDLTGNR